MLLLLCIISHADKLQINAICRSMEVAPSLEHASALRIMSRVETASLDIMILACLIVNVSVTKLTFLNNYQFESSQIDRCV